jgi:hypothetical protein
VGLPVDFHFSQGSLQDYVDCPRRFQLRHLMRLAWPAIPAEPPLDNERFLRQGAAFHRLLQQHLLGVQVENLNQMEMDPELRQWWQNYLNTQPDPEGGLPDGLEAELAGPGKLCLIEISLSAPLCDYRLVGKFDALVLCRTEAGAGVKIFEWKTSHSRESAQNLADRLQTRVYPYLLVRASQCFTKGLRLPPEQVEMIYWFAGFPRQAQCFTYSTEHYHRDRLYLEGLVAKIEAQVEGGFPLSPGSKVCRWCTYRSLCERGVRAGNFYEDDALVEESQDAGASGGGFNFEQIGEISF